MTAHTRAEDTTQHCTVNGVCVCVGGGGNFTEERFPFGEKLRETLEGSWLTGRQPDALV